MAKGFAGNFITFLVVVLFFSGCKKFEKNGQLRDPGIVITFDDDRIDNWFTYLPMLDSVGITALPPNKKTNWPLFKVTDMKLHFMVPIITI